MTEPLDLERLARAFHEAKKVGGPWHPCATIGDDAKMVDVGFDEDPNGDFACLCRAQASQLVEEYRRLAKPTERPDAWVGKPGCTCRWGWKNEVSYHVESCPWRAARLARGVFSR